MRSTLAASIAASLLLIVVSADNVSAQTTQALSTRPTPLGAALSAYRNWWYDCGAFPSEIQQQIIARAAVMKPENAEAMFWQSRAQRRELVGSPRESTPGIDQLTKRSAELGFKPAIAHDAVRRLGDLKISPGDRVAAQQQLDAMAEERQPDALELLGQIYEQGTDTIPRDLLKAAEYYQAARGAGCKRASGELADVLLKVGKPSDAMSALRLGADAGDVNAQVKLGRWLENGVPQPVNLKKAEEWLRRAAATGYPDAEAELATLLSKKDGAGSDKEIVPLLTAAAQYLDGAKFKLAQIYLIGGFGQSIDLKRAEKFFREAAAEGMPQANFELGRAEVIGLWLPKNIPSGLRHLQIAARAGDTDAQGFLNLYDHLQIHRPATQSATHSN